MNQHDYPPKPDAAPSRDALTAREAAALLGVKPSTVYAYVSRGKLQRVPDPAGTGRRYLRADVERLLARKGAPEARRPGPGSALQWGDPVIETRVSRITAEGPQYRGRPALELAASGAAFEAVAERLWGADPGEPWTDDGPGFDVGLLAALAGPHPTPLVVLALVIPALAAMDPGRFDRRPTAVRSRARVIIRRLAASLALVGGAPEGVSRALRSTGVARVLAAAAGIEGEERVAALNLTLVLWAEHELNASAFAARVAASAGADPYACISAGLAALSGPRHGAASEQFEAWVAEAGQPERAEAAVHARLRRGESLPGFGHPLYPAGDPRARPLLAAARRLAPDDRRTRTTLALVDAVAALDGPPPTIDVGLAAICAALGLAPGFGPGVLAVGRCAGWVAHVLEQYAQDFLIRPRARFGAQRPPR